MRRLEGMYYLDPDYAMLICLISPSLSLSLTLAFSTEGELYRLELRFEQGAQQTEGALGLTNTYPCSIRVKGIVGLTQL